jgi:hypothetical protein
MSIKSRNTRKSSVSRKAMTVAIPATMWELLNHVGSKIYTPARAGQRKLNPKYAPTICMVLEDNDQKAAAQLMKLALVAYKDFAELSGDAVKFAP